MAKFTKTQMSLIVEFAQHQYHAEKFAQFASNDIRNSAPYYRDNLLNCYESAHNAVKIAREIGMTDDDIMTCHHTLLVWADFHNKQEAAA